MAPVSPLQREVWGGNAQHAVQCLINTSTFSGPWQGQKLPERSAYLAQLWVPVLTSPLHVLTGDKGDRGPSGTPGKPGKNGTRGDRGSQGIKGDKGQAGSPGSSCQTHYSAFSVGRKTGLHSSENFLSVLFDRVFVNTDGHFDMATGRFVAPLRGLYFFSLNVHSWNYKETYVHIVHNEQAVVILYAQPSERSIMQSQSVMLPLVPGDYVWVRLFKRERENGIYSDDVDTYITFSGHLIKAEDN